MCFLEYSWVFECTSWNLSRTWNFSETWNIFWNFLKSSWDFLITFRDWFLEPFEFPETLIPGIFLGLFLYASWNFLITSCELWYFLKQYFLKFLEPFYQYFLELTCNDGYELYLFSFAYVIQGIFLSICFILLTWYWHYSCFFNKKLRIGFRSKTWNLKLVSMYWKLLKVTESVFDLVVFAGCASTVRSSGSRSEAVPKPHP